MKLMTNIKKFGGGPSAPTPPKPTPPPPPPSKTADQLKDREDDELNDTRLVGQSLRIKRGSTGVSGGGATGLGI